jgi:hypothetical protein
VAVTATNQFQAGWKEAAYGRVLPGYHVIEEGEVDKICDPQKGAQECEPMVKAAVDSEGFLMVG